MCELVVSPIDVEEMGKRIQDYWDEISCSMWGLFAHMLPASCLLKLVSIDLSSAAADNDRLAWRGGGDKFTVKAAYKLSMNWEREEMWEGWKRVWNLKLQ